MTIECGVCLIRPYRAADAADVARQANNPKVWANVRDYFPHPYTEQNAAEWVAFASSATPMTNFAIEAEGRFAGGIGLRLQTDVDRISAELGYWLGEEFWGRGIATASIKGFVPWAFGAFPELERIYATPFHWNVASSRALEKAAFNKEGVMRRAAIKAGVVADVPLYATYRNSDLVN